MILVWAVGAAGSAAVLHTEGREFEPLTAYQNKKLLGDSPSSESVFKAQE